MSPKRWFGPFFRERPKSEQERDRLHKRVRRLLREQELEKTREAGK